MVLEPEVVSNTRATAWKPVTLTMLFGGQSKRPSLLAPAEVDAESALMQALAEVAAEEEEDERPDDGGIEIQSEDEYAEQGGRRPYGRRIRGHANNL